MAKDKEYVVGDEVSVGGLKGVVTRVGSNGGNAEYTVAVSDETNNRPVSIPSPVHPAAFTDGPIEQAAANKVTYDEARESSEEATKELERANVEAEDNEDADQVKATDSPDEVRSKTVTPDPVKTPAGNASAVKTTASKSSK